MAVQFNWLYVGGGTALGKSGYGLGTYWDPENPLNLPPYTIRIRIPDGQIPPVQHDGGSYTQVSEYPNIWDYTYPNPDWSYRFGAWPFGNPHPLEVLGSNSSGITSMQGLLQYKSVTSVHLSKVDSVTDLSYLCRECHKLQSLQIDGTYVGSGANTEYMCYQCAALNNLALDSSLKSTNTGYMFYQNILMETAPSFHTENNTNMQYMFSGCKALKNVSLYDASQVQDMRSTFYSCTSLQTLPAFNTSSCYMFESFCEECSSLQRIPLLDLSAISTHEGIMRKMFKNCVNVQAGALDLYNSAKNLTSASYLWHSESFRNCGSNTTTGKAELAQIPGDWK